MKCKWYADLGGVCTNGECPYRGGTCPTSEHPEVCKYSEYTENKYEVSELVKILRCCSNIGYVCEECPANLDGEDCNGRLAKLQAAAMRRAEPKNRVLTLEEAQKKCQEDGITWYESLRHESPIVFPAYVTPIDPTDELVNIYTFFAGTEETVELYGKEWRCWLRKPTETERWETPWES